jgi:site-specific DNA recombinase
MKAIGYVRVSTDEQAREGISLENQKLKIHTYCDLHNFELDTIIEDAGKSGKDLNREGVQELIQKVKDKRIGAVLVYKLDRLSRKVIDTLNLIELMKRNHVERNMSMKMRHFPQTFSVSLHHLPVMVY